MANTGFLNPVSAYTVSAGAGGTRPWVSGGSTGSLASAVRVSDNLRVILDDISAAVIPFPMFAQFDLGLLSAGALVDVQGFTVRYERGRNAAALSANETWLRLVSGAGTGLQFLGTTANSNTGNWSTTDTYVTAGGSGTMFGLVTADASVGRFAAGRFGFAVNIRYGAGTTLTSAIAQIDHMQLQVHYKAVPIIDVRSSEYDWDHQNVSGVRTDLFTATSAFNADAGGTNWQTPAEVTSNNATYASAQTSAGAAGSDVLTVRYDGLLGLPADAVVSSLTVYTCAKVCGGVMDIELALGTAAITAAAQVCAAMSAGTEIRVQQTVSADNASFDQFVSANILRNPFFAVVYLPGAAGDYAVQVDHSQVEVTYKTETAAGGYVHLDHIVGGGANTTDVFSAEFDHEHQSVDLTWNIVVQSAEFGYEVQSVSISNNIIVASSEYDYEAQSVALAGVLVVQSAEFDWEASSAAIVISYNLVVQSGEWDWEVRSVALSNNVVVQSSEYDHEIQSVGVTSGGFSIGVSTGEWDWEARSVALALNLVVQSAEFDYEVRSVALSKNLVVQSAEFDWEARSVAIERSVIVQSAEFDWEARSVALTQTYALVVQSAEFDWEAGSVFISAAMRVTGGEWDWEAQSVALSKNVVVQSAEFDWEARSVALVRGLVVQSAEFDYEVQSVQLTGGSLLVNNFEWGWEAASVALVGNLRVTNAEFGYEVESVSISNILGIGDAEFDWEARSVALAFNIVVPDNAQNEYDWEADSINLHQFYDVSAGAIGGFEQGWETGEPSPTIRFFDRHPETPPDRIKYARTGALN